MSNTEIQIECDRYKHYKGKYYYVLGYAHDSSNRTYVIYRAAYDEKLFWIRPIEMFYECLDDGSPRFSKEHDDNASCIIEKAINELAEGKQDIFHSESKDKYMVVSMNTQCPLRVEVTMVYSTLSGYLSDAHLARRMGWHLYSVDGSKKITEINDEGQSLFGIFPSDNPETHTKENNRKIIESNPKRLAGCSVDLKISNKLFYKTKGKTVDIRSLENAKKQSDGSNYWKALSEKKVEHLVLRPKQSIATRTLEWIKIPKDCAGKIEIRSTYARLSLSVTTGDFCNPGWEGFFPLVLRNDGTNPVKIYPGDVMLQIMLIPISSMAIQTYGVDSNIPSFMQDDGTPINFWNNKYIKEFRKQSGHQKILDFYYKMDEQYSDNPDLRKRFDNTFLGFCNTKIHNNSYRDQHGEFNVQKLYNDYISKERWRAKMWKEKTFNAILALVAGCVELFLLFADAVGERITLPLFSWVTKHKTLLMVIFAVIFIFAIIRLILVLFTDKHYCTEKRSIP